jgi:opacity protein-like surface antigen
MKIKSISTLFAMAALGLATSAIAAPVSGMYWGGGLGHSQMNIEVPAGMSVNDSGTSYSLAAGIRATKNIAVEVEYSQLGDIKVSDGTNTQTGKGDALTLSGIGFVPVFDKTEAFMRAGLAYTTFEVGTERRTSVQPVLGVGADYQLTPMVSVRGEVQYLPSFAGSTTDAMNSKVSVNYRF